MEDLCPVLSPPFYLLRQSRAIFVDAPNAIQNPPIFPKFIGAGKGFLNAAVFFFTFYALLFSEVCGEGSALSDRWRVSFFGASESLGPLPGPLSVIFRPSELYGFL